MQDSNRFVYLGRNGWVRLLMFGKRNEKFVRKSVLVRCKSKQFYAMPTHRIAMSNVKFIAYCGQIYSQIIRMAKASSCFVFVEFYDYISEFESEQVPN